MAKQKPQIIKDTKGNWTYKVHTSSKEDDAERESAAAEEKEQTEVEYKSLAPVNSPVKGNRKRNHLWKPILISAGSAILVGTIMGFFLIRMFGQVDTPTSTENPSQTTPAVTQAEQEEASPDTVTASLDPLESYILQAGVFSEEENAESLIAGLTDLNIPTAFFERDGEFFLMAGVTPSEDTAESLAASLSDNQAELYVKEWNTQPKEIEMTEAERDWITAFQAFFDEQLHQTDLHQPIADETIAALVDKAPESGEAIDGLVSHLTEMQGEPSFYQLLSWMKAYEEL
ncbi:SPOR domain-containing protein [Oceanobacillus timonensis]|uniref:SPOR domain-containing protein n=1 Tax=Oceanobacillus timonensis TaxID=1926285 RepID=UPI0009BC1DFC|nr:SPOR domain-containing protein [Oceanobacillus timonensis]